MGNQRAESVSADTVSVPKSSAKVQKILSKDRMLEVLPDRLLYHQRTIGNRKVQRLIQSGFLDSYSKASRPIGRAALEQIRRRGLSTPFLRNRPVISSSPVAISRARVTVGNARAEINYGDVSKVAAADYLSTIQTRFQAYAGAALDAAVVTQITAFSHPQQQWVLFALDILAENTAQAPGLNRTQAFQRLVDRAPSSTTHPLGTADLAFEREVLVTSGWAEEATSGHLATPTAAQQAAIDQLLNPPPAPGAPPAGVFDAATFKAELPSRTRARLTAAGQNPANWPGRQAQSLPDVQAVGNAIQTRALTFFSPFAETARDNRWLAGWQYGPNISSVTTDPGGAPRAISRNDRLNLIRNRATIAGTDEGNGPSIFARTNFDANRDAAALDAVVSALEADPTVQPLVDELLRHTGQANTQTHRVRIATEVSSANTECTVRWETIRTLCHELLHALAHPDFIAAISGSARFPQGANRPQILREGFTEVLGVELFTSLRATAAHDATLLGQLIQGIAGTCVPPTAPITLGYGASGAGAQRILGQVGADRFRAAYFHGKVSLIGL